MRRLTLCVVAIVAGAIIAGLQPGHAAACTGAPFGFQGLADTVRLSDVVAIGTLRGNDGATIGLDVDTYYKAPPGRPPRLIVNNLWQQGWPDCTSRPLRMRVFEEGTPVLAVLKADDQGVGARWRGAMIQGTGIMPLQDGRIVHLEMGPQHFERKLATRAEVDAEMARIGAPATKPDPTTPPERPLAPTSPLTCLYDPPTIQSLTAAATVVGIGVVVERTPDVVTFRVDDPLKGATGATTVRVNNHYFGGGLSDCREEMRADNRIMNDREPVFLFLARDTSGVGADWRPVGIDAQGMFLWGDIPWPNADGTGPMPFEAVRAEVLKLVAAAPTPAATSPGEVAAADRGARGWAQWWAAAALGLLVVAGASALAWRLHRR